MYLKALYKCLGLLTLHVSDGGADASTRRGTFRGTQSIGFGGGIKGELSKNDWTDLNDLYVV